MLVSVEVAPLENGSATLLSVSTRSFPEEEAGQSRAFWELRRGQGAVLEPGGVVTRDLEIPGHAKLEVLMAVAHYLGAVGFDPECARRVAEGARVLQILPGKFTNFSFTFP